MIETLLTAATLLNEPQARTAKNGKPYATARVRCSDGAGNPHSVSVIAFDDEPREAIQRLTQGEHAAIAGSLTVGTYTAPSGDTRASMNMTAVRVLSVYQANGLRKQGTAPVAGSSPAAAAQRRKPRPMAPVVAATPATADSFADYFPEDAAALGHKVQPLLGPAGADPAPDFDAPPWD